MKTLTEIYESLVSKFTKRTKLDIYQGSVIDKFTVSVADELAEVYNEIENAKNPHIYTKLSGSDIDSMGMLVGIAREENESDQNYLYRMLNWNISNASANSTCIEDKLINLKYASNAQFVPYTSGVGTGTIYIIPKSLDLETKEKAINEVRDKIEPIKGATSVIEYIIPKMLRTNIVVYYSVYKDEDNVKMNIENKFKEYINNIAPGDLLEIGQLNKLGNEELNMNFFTINTVLIDNEQLDSLSKMQTLNKKFIFDSITWIKVDE